MNKNLRVMHVVSKLSTYGAEHLVAQLAQELSERDIEVSVLTLYDSSPPRSAFQGTVFSARRSHRWDAGFFFRMVCLMRAWRPAVVHTHVHNGKYWGRLAAIVAGVPQIVHTEHNSDFRAGALERMSNRLLHHASARIVAFSEPHAKALASAERVSREKIAIIPNGIEQRERADRQSARSILGVGEHEEAILVVGRLESVKNQQLAIHALRYLPEERAARTKLFIVGDGADRGALLGLAQRTDVADRVRFLGYRSDVRAILAGADALLVTSLNEAMPLAVIEAIAAGVSIATTPWYGVETIVHNGVGRIASGWSPREVADALLFVLQARTPNKMPQSTRLPESYDISVTAQRHIELYEALV